jgi:hypothetical protein
MAKVTAMTDLATPASGDFVYVVDISDITDDPAGSSRKATLTNLTKGLQAATTGAQGAMSAADKTKLDGIATGATVYTDEMAQDAIGVMVDATLTYTDATPLLTRAALTGDVTASAGSNATAIANDAVSNAKLANVATATFKGRATAGTGDPEDLTQAQATALINVATASLSGAMSSANFTKLDNYGTINAQTGTAYTTVAGDNGKVITMNNAAANTLTVHSTAEAGFNALIIQKGAGQTTVAAGGTGAILNFSSHTKLAGQKAVASIFVESNAGTAPQAYFAGDTAA